MHAAVQLIFRSGVKATRQLPLVGQLESGEEKGRHMLRLWPLNWVENVHQWHEPPLAVLWQPVFLCVRGQHLIFTGLEVHGKPRHRRWMAQKWSCEVLTATGARDYFAGYPYGELAPAPGIPPSPADPELPPFG